MNLEELRKHASEDVLSLNADVFGYSSLTPSKRKNKYNAHKVHVDGMTFDSKGEYRRWLTLVAMRDANLIQNLQRQVTYVLQDAFVDNAGVRHHSIKYTADHIYQEDGITVIEDYKSKITAKGEAFRIRWRMLCEKFKDDPSTRCVLAGLDRT